MMNSVCIKMMNKKMMQHNVVVHLNKRDVAKLQSIISLARATYIILFFRNNYAIIMSICSPTVYQIF